MSSSGIVDNEDEFSVSEDESYFSSLYEPEYLTRLSLALSKDAKPGAKHDRNSTRSGHPGTPRLSTSTRASTTTTASTLSSLSFQSDSVVYNFPLPPSPRFSPPQQWPYQLGSLTHLPKSPIEQAKAQDWTQCRTSSDVSEALPQILPLAIPPRHLRKKPAAKLRQQESPPPPTNRRTASDASAALPQWMAAELPIRRESAAQKNDDPDADLESDFVKSFRARLCAPERQRRAAFGTQKQTAREALEARAAAAAAMKPKKSKVTVTSPTLANKLGVSLRSDVDLFIDDINVRQDADSVVEDVSTDVRGGSLWSYHF